MDKLRQILRSKHFKYGTPFFLLVVGSPFLTKEFQQVRYDYKRQKFVKEELDEALSKANVVKREVSPEDIYEEYMEKEYKSDYEIVRGPRPWENQEQTQKS